MSCFVMVHRASRPLPFVMSERPLRIPDVVPLSRFVPFRFVRPAAGLPGKRDPFPRVSRARGRAFAPARFARLIARANQSAHFACASNRGRSAPGRRGGKRSARTSPPWDLSYHNFL